MTNPSWPKWPVFSQEEIGRVEQVLLSGKVNYWTGSEGRAFEVEFAEFCEADHAVALTNGTVALELAWKALGISPGDEVIVTARSFIASATSVIWQGGIPIFADVDRDSQNITAETIAPLITSKTKAILCVHLAGWPCDMNPILDLAKAHNLFVVEDCAQAHGARYCGRPVGAIGDIGAWSFCQEKVITLGGEGGMITLNDKERWAAIWSLKDHGKSWHAINEPFDNSGFRWLHDCIGTNGRLTEMQSAIGRVQLSKIEQWHEARRANGTAIQDFARKCTGLRVPEMPNHVEHAWYKCYVFIEADALKSGWSRDRIVDEIRSNGVPCYSGSCPEIYLEKAIQDLGLQPEKRLPVAHELGETALMFQVHPTLTSQHIELTCAALDAVMTQAVK